MRPTNECPTCLLCSYPVMGLLLSSSYRSIVYFGNYEKLVYQSQSSDNNLVELAETYAEKLNLNFEHRHTGFGDLAKFVKKLA